jgi:hypothetical protein
MSKLEKRPRKCPNKSDRWVMEKLKLSLSDTCVSVRYRNCLNLPLIFAMKAILKNEVC